MSPHLDQETLQRLRSFRLRYQPEISGEEAALIFEFFMVYSRFEFALKEIPQFRRERDDGHVEPDWRSFADFVKLGFNPDQTPELRQAFDYYLQHPPKIQGVEDNLLSWNENLKRASETDFTWVMRSIKGVRNNLFHGGKFPWDSFRDVNLLMHGLVILYACLELDRRVRNKFLFGE